MAGRRARRSPALRQTLGRLYDLLASQHAHEHPSFPVRNDFVRRWTQLLTGKFRRDSLQSDVTFYDSAFAFNFLLETLPQKTLQKRISALVEQTLPQDAEATEAESQSEPTTPQRQCLFTDLDLEMLDEKAPDYDLIFMLSPLSAEEELSFGHQAEVYHLPADETLAFAEDELAQNSVKIRVPRPRTTRSQLDQALTRLRRTTRSGDRIEAPKKEYFRCQHIRALKKSLRQIEGQKMPGTSIHRVDPGNLIQRDLWAQMQALFSKNFAALSPLSSTNSGPVTDGKSKRTQSGNSQEKSFNNEFCRKFFESSAIQEYNALFCDLVYDVSPESLCSKLKLRCCGAVDHNQDCVELWSEVKRYAKNGMQEELEVTRARTQSEEDVDLLAEDRS